MIVASLLIAAFIASACGSASEIETTADVTATTTNKTVSPSTSTTTLSTATATPLTTTRASNPNNTLAVITDTAQTPMLPFELEDKYATNLNDRSTPLGMLCWAYWEIARIVLINSAENLVDYFQIFDMIYPVDFDHDYTIVNALEEITKPEVLAIVNDPKLPVEVQLFANKFFANAEASLEQVEAVGHDQIDFTKLPYSNLERNVDAFEKVARANPDECVLYTQQ